QLLSQSDLPLFHLDCVTTLPAALNKFRGNAHDVCIIDSAGNKAAEILAQARRVGCLIPTIVLTSDSGRHVLESFHAGAADCLFREGLTALNLEQSIRGVFLDAQNAARQLENEQRYQALVETAKDIIYTHDLNGN